MSSNESAVKKHDAPAILCANEAFVTSLPINSAPAQFGGKTTTNSSQSDDGLLAELPCPSFVPVSSAGQNMITNNEKWQMKFEFLRQYKEEHGDCLVPSKQGTLGRWVKTQRCEYKQDILSEYRISKLNSIGFVWDAARKAKPNPSLTDESPQPTTGQINHNRSIFLHDEKWRVNLEELKKYKKQNGHCRVPAKFETDHGKRLGAWVSQQRHFYSKGNLSQDRIDALIAVGFCWKAWQVKSTGNKRVPAVRLAARRPCQGEGKRNRQVNKINARVRSNSDEQNSLAFPEASAPAPKRSKTTNESETTLQFEEATEVTRTVIASQFLNIIGDQSQDEDETEEYLFI